MKNKEIIVDTHIHSHYSRATSKNLTPEGLYYWGKIKGINVIGTGDFTHPGWFAELREKFDQNEQGLFELKKELSREIDKTLPASVKNNIIRFVPTVEISTIYSKNGAVRKLHNVIVAPDFEIVSKINASLDRIGNLKADGRPILGMDSKELLKITLDSHPDSLFYPAHIWTPWFAMFGSKSGFDSIEDAFEELSPEIKAIETGLSSDPFMNWRIKEIQTRTILSNSDAHSPQKLGREATILSCEYSYKDIIESIRTNDKRVVGTIEFFPQEGKYHYDGHRLCNVKCTPTETRKLNGICPVCHRPLTVGVEYRVSELADYDEDFRPDAHKRVEYIIPLSELIAQLKGKKTGTKLVDIEYNHMIRTFGDEFSILRTISVEDIRRAGFADMAHIIERMRKGDIYIDPGYDGVYGTITLFRNENERSRMNDQLSLL